jgi:hypothetical protein
MLESDCSPEFLLYPIGYLRHADIQLTKGRVLRSDINNSHTSHASYTYIQTQQIFLLDTGWSEIASHVRVS